LTAPACGSILPIMRVTFTFKSFGACSAGSGTGCGAAPLNLT
jgi:hypothetical protein